MSFPWNDRIPRYLSITHEINKSYRTYDIHLHPVEIISNLLDYKEVPGEKGLFSIDGGKFITPSLKSLEGPVSTEEIITFMKRRPQIIPMMLRRTYNHTGPRVFREYFNILGIDKGLLLPVAPEEGPIDPQMSLTYKMFKRDARFCMAGCVPNKISNERVEFFLKGQIEKFHIIAVKIHPNITAINLNLAEGKERIECIIAACSVLGLPVIIHSGQSLLPKKKTSSYAEISNLKDISFSSSVPIIIAHGGTYGHSPSEIHNEVIPILKNLLRSYENIMIDVSGLDHKNILLFLSLIEEARVLFGSDALYENQILMLMRFLFALENSRLKFEKSLIRILCENAAEYVFKENYTKSIQLENQS